jgi:hypothetical protein
MEFPRVLMTASALVLALLGLPCVFAPDIVLRHVAGGTSAPTELIVQITGALYAGFAIVDWMAKGSLKGGIYGRPLAVGNLLHFFAAALALLKAAPTFPQPLFAWPLAGIYTLLAIGFGLVIFRNPVRS